MTENERRVRATNGDTYWEACAMLARSCGRFDLAADFEEYARGGAPRHGDRDSLPNQLRRDVVDVEIAYAALAKAREVRP